MTAKTRVLVTTGLYPPEIGGPATYSKMLVDHLPKSEFSVRVLPFSSVRFLPKVLRHIAYVFLVIRCGRKSHVLFAQDTVSVGWPTYFANLFLWKKCVVRVPGDHVWEQGQQRACTAESLDDFPVWSRSWPLYLKLLRRLQFIVVRRAHAVVVPSEYLKRIALKWGVKETRVHVVPNTFTSLQNTEKEPQPLDIPQGTLVVSVGRFVPWKGFEGLLRAMVPLAHDVPDIHLLLVGSGPEEKRLRALVEELRLSKRVTFTGALEKQALATHINKADLFVLNSTYEGFSHLLLEAMTLGTPVVATTAGGNPEVIENEKEGLLVPPNDTDALYANILAALRNREPALERAARAKEKAQTFTVDRAVSGTIRVLKQVTSAH